MKLFLDRFLTSKPIRFLLMGGINTATTYLVYLLLATFVHYQIAYVISYIAGIAFSYFLNAKFVFSVSLNRRGLFLFPLVYGFQYLVGFAAMFFLVEKMNVDHRIAPIIVTIVTIPVTYCLSKWILTEKS